MHDREKRYKHEDARDMKKAQEMVKIYLTFWGEKYRASTGRLPDASVLGRIHNGGPFGFTKDATFDYGKKCARLYKQWEFENK
jgi:hypothetical protein